MDDKKELKRVQPDNTVEVKGVLINLCDPPVKVEGLRLNIGCGTDIKKGFLNVDKYSPKADALWDIISIPLNNDSVAQIICYDVLEHLSMKDAINALEECFRVLKPGGTLVSTTPDIVSYCKNIVDHPEDEYAITRLYGNQSHEGQFHKNGFTTKSLFKYLGNAGFKTISTAYFDLCPGVTNIYCEATK